jgi:hypothetical protein
MAYRFATLMAIYGAIDASRYATAQPFISIIIYLPHAILMKIHDIEFSLMTGCWLILDN